MAIDMDAAEEAACDDFVDRLRVHDIHYIGGGSVWQGAIKVLNRDAPFPSDHVGAWEDVGRHVLDDMCEDALADAPA